MSRRQQAIVGHYKTIMELVESPKSFHQDETQVWRHSARDGERLRVRGAKCISYLQNTVASAALLGEDRFILPFLVELEHVLYFVTLPHGPGRRSTPFRLPAKYLRFPEGQCAGCRLRHGWSPIV